MIINNKYKKLIEENPIALGTVDKKNNPNVIAVAYVKVISPNQILVTDNFMEKTKKNIQNNNNVCLAVWGKDWEGCKIIGKAKYFTTGKWKKYVEQMKENKGLPSKGAILITVSSLI